jgi:hypothetical protein
MGRKVARMGYIRIAYSVLSESHKKRNQLSEEDVDMMIILNWGLDKSYVKM